MNRDLEVIKRNIERAKFPFDSKDVRIVCGDLIFDNRYGYTGLDENEIFLETCDDYKCVRWFEVKVKWDIQAKTKAEFQNNRYVWHEC